MLRRVTHTYTLFGDFWLISLDNLCFNLHHSYPNRFVYVYFWCYYFNTLFSLNLYLSIFSDVVDIIWWLLVALFLFGEQCVYPSSLSRIILTLVRFLVLNHQPMKYIFSLSESILRRRKVSLIIITHRKVS
jgi:hypothetical protein